MAATTVRSLEERLDDFATEVMQKFEELTSSLGVHAENEEKSQGLLVELNRKLHQVSLEQGSQQEEQDGIQTKLVELTVGMAANQSQLATMMNALSVQQAQTATAVAKFENLVEDLKQTRSRLEATTIRLDSPDSGLASIAGKVVVSMSEMKHVTEKLDAHRVDFASFHGRVDATLAFAKWIGATAALTLISVILASFAIARSAGQYESSVQEQQKTLSEIKQELADIRKQK